MELLQYLTSVLSIVVSILLTVIGYQYKVMREQNKILNAFQLLIHEPGILQKLYLHILMEDPREAAKERLILDQRIRRLEEIIKLIATKKKTQKLIDDKIQKIP